MSKLDRARHIVKSVEDLYGSGHVEDAFAALLELIEDLEQGLEGAMD